MGPRRYEADDGRSSAGSVKSLLWLTLGASILVQLWETIGGSWLVVWLVRCPWNRGEKQPKSPRLMDWYIYLAEWWQKASKGVWTCLDLRPPPTLRANGERKKMWRYRVHPFQSNQLVGSWFSAVSIRGCFSAVAPFNSFYWQTNQKPIKNSIPT